MVGKPDGTILIDTKVAAENLSKGMAKIRTSVATVLKAVSLIAFGFVTLILVIQRFSSELFETLKKGIDKTSAYYSLLQQLEGAFNKVKGALFSVFATLLQAVLPYLVMAADWLARMLERANMFLAALFGQKSVMRAIVKQTQAQEKAAKGVLAAFDQINVLQTKEAEQTVDQNPITFETVKITDDILDKVQSIRDIVAGWFTDPVGKLKETWGGLVNWFREHVIVPLSEWWKNTWLSKTIVGDIVEGFFKMISSIRAFWDKYEIGQLFGRLWENAREAWTNIYEIVKDTFVRVLEAATQTFDGIVTLMQGILEGNWKKVFEGLKGIAVGVFNTIDAIADGVFGVLVALVQGWIAQFRDTLPVLGQIFRDVWDGIIAVAEGFTRGIANLIIGIVNAMIRAVASGVNRVIDMLNNIQVDIPEWIPVFGGSSFGLSIPNVSAPQIPRLAKGAVIPPNSQFLAVLGDQKSGRNIEAPEDLLRQIVREELVGTNGEVTVNMPVYLDGEQIYQNQRRVQLRHGASLISGGLV